MRQVLCECKQVMLTVTRDEFRRADTLKHGNNPEHSLVVLDYSVEPWEANVAPVSDWLDRLHAYESKENA